jgi:septal ring factor EnvC (AmiA/AmiB activator)
MAKLTLDEKIEKTQEEIKKTKAVIAANQEKLKKLNADLKALTKEKDANFANDILAIVSQGVTLTNEDRAAILAKLSSVLPAAKPETGETPDSENSYNEACATSSTFGTNQG